MAQHDHSHHDRVQAPGEPEVVIRVRDLKVAFGDKVIMDGLDLDVLRGEILGFVGGSGQGKASNSGEGMDDFVFQITQEEFLDFMFEDLELPNLIKRHLTGTDTFPVFVAKGHSV